MYNNFDIIKSEVISEYFSDPMKHFIYLQAPKISELISKQDENDLYSITTSSDSIKRKISNIDKIMLKYPYFKRIGTGTNRVAYKNLDYDKQIVKIATDIVAIDDGRREMINQRVLAPLCTKIFEVSDNGIITSSEYVLPIKTYKQFEIYSDRVYDIIVDKFIDKGVILDDIGFSFYKNWGIRFESPILLDFPYMYTFNDIISFKCNTCNGNIIFDDMLNYFQCTKCGKDGISSETIGLDIYKEFAKSDIDNLIMSSNIYIPRVKVSLEGKIIVDTSKTQIKTNFIESLYKKDDKTLEEIISEEDF